MQKARYKALGVDCHRHCFVFGCKYERIEDELKALGIEKDPLTALIETISGGPPIKPRKSADPLPSPPSPQEAPCASVEPS